MTEQHDARRYPQFCTRRQTHSASLQGTMTPTTLSSLTELRWAWKVRPVDWQPHPPDPGASRMVADRSCRTLGSCTGSDFPIRVWPQEPLGRNNRGSGRFDRVRRGLATPGRNGGLSGGFDEVP